MNGTATTRERAGAAWPRLLALALMSLTAGAADATPYRPASDDTVIERVPERSDLERLAPLRAALAAHPADEAAALTLATAYIEVGRRNSDPRFTAYAQATLAPWVSAAAPSERALVLQALALQYLHRFDESLALLERALHLQPLDGQAWLTRASLLELRGDYAGARRACARLVRSADEFTALTCLKSVDGRSGELAPSYALLEAAPDPRLPGALRAWRLAVVADMAERLGHDGAAEEALRAALRAAPQDPFLKASYADLLLRLERPAEVSELLKGGEAQDPLLLRLAIAARRTGSPDATRLARVYRERLSAAQRDRDFSHQREQALFLLDVDGDARAALAAALTNFRVQREPADVRLYARAALAAHSQEDLNSLRTWLTTTRYQDYTLPAALTRAEELRP